MATKPERTDIAVLKDQMKRANSDIKEIKGDVKEVLGRFDNLDNKYPTRREIAAIKWVLGILIAAVSAIATILSVSKS